MEADSDSRTTLLYDFYYKNFYNPLYEQIKFEPLAIRLFDLGVNLSVHKAVELLQNTCNRLAADAQIGVDGKFGKGTLEKVNSSPENLYPTYKNIVENYYRSLPDFNHFGKGWLARLNREA